MLTALILKKTITLIALVEPFSMIPLYLAAVRNDSPAGKERFALALGLTVTLALLGAGFFAKDVLDALGISTASMQIGGGVIALILAVAMVLGHELEMKSTAAQLDDVKCGRAHGITPLGVPLLAGPAAFSYMLTHSDWHSVNGIAAMTAPVAIVGLVTWATFSLSHRAERFFSPTTLNIIERLAGFLLTGLSIEMIVSGLKASFPALS